jgi:hypothetical protein
MNPFGPTLNALVLDGESGAERQLPVLYLMLNPFSQKVTEVGRATIADEWNLFGELPRFSHLPFGSCPTLLLPSAMLTHEDAVLLYARFLATFDDGYEVLGGVRQFPGDPWKRVKQAMDGIGGTLARLMAGQEDAAGRKLTEDEAMELSADLLEPANLRSELEAFLAAWHGSIKFQGHGGVAATAMSVDEFARYLGMLAASCNLPELGEQ